MNRRFAPSMCHPERSVAKSKDLHFVGIGSPANSVQHNADFRLTTLEAAPRLLLNYAPGHPGVSGKTSFTSQTAHPVS